MGLSALPIPAGSCPETQVADQTSKLCTLILKAAQGLLISKEGFHGLLLPLPKSNLLFLLLLTLADVFSQ